MSINGGNVNDETTEYPIKTDHLVKGDTVDALTIEQAFSVKRETDAYRFAMLRASDYVTRRFRDRGETVTVVDRKHNLVILTDAEAAEYNDQRFAIELRGAARAHARNLGVDRANLTTAQVRTHDRALEVNGRLLGAIRKERVAILSEHKRSTPLPPGAKSK